MVGTAKHYAPILKQASELDLKTQFLSMRSAEDPILLQTAGGFAEGLIYSYPFDATSKSNAITEKFVKSFKEKHNAVPDAYAAEGYEGFRLLALAFVQCGKNYDCIKSWLSNLKDYDSAFGKISFDSNGDVYYNFFLKTIKDGQFVKYEE